METPDCLTNFGNILRCWDKHLTLYWRKCDFMVKGGIVLGHIIPSEGVEVGKANVHLIVNLLVLTCVKDIHSFLGHVSFYMTLIKNFSKIGKSSPSLVGKGVPFIFPRRIKWHLQSLRRYWLPSYLTSSRLGQQLELVCDASDYEISVVFG